MNLNHAVTLVRAPKKPEVRYALDGSEAKTLGGKVFCMMLRAQKEFLTGLVVFLLSEDATCQH